MNKSVSKQFAVTIGIVFVSLTVLLIYTISSFYMSSIKDLLNLGQSNLQSEASQIESYIGNGKSILWTTADTVNIMMEQGATSEEIVKYLTSEYEHQKAQVDENFTGIYGYINGEYLDGSGWVPPSDYEPTSRDWYTAAKEADGKTVLVQPYMDAKTHTIMISISQLLSDKKSVVSLDLTLNEVQKITKNMSLNRKGYCFIVDQTGLVIAHSDEKQLGLTYPSNDKQKNMMKLVLKNDETTDVTKIDGKDFAVFSKKILDGWYVVMVIDNSSLYEDLSHQILVNIFAGAFVFSIVLIFCIIAYRRIQSHQKKDAETQEMLRKQYLNTIRALAYTIDAKDRYTSGHSQRVADYSLAIAKRMGKSDKEQKIIYYAGLLHDVGKIRVPEDVINKAGKLTDEEFNQIKIHPISGFHILKDIYEDKELSFGAKFHHERYDGKGYPNGLSGENIPEIARIIGVADAYDAMASNRSYRNALPQEVVRSEIEKGRGTQFDPAIADIMLQMIDEDTDYTLCESERSQQNILIIDDEAMNFKMLQHIFKNKSHYSLLCATTKEEAKEILRKEQVDLVLLDLLLPDVKEFELFEYIHDNYDIPVVLMTADKSIDTILKATAYEVDDYMTKPFFPDAVKETVHGIISNRQ